MSTGIHISKNVSLKEATASATGTRLGIDNIPPDKTIEVMKITANRLFEPLRDQLGVPIKVLSFYRSSKLNKAVGGAAHSQHMTGEAMDLQAIGKPNSAIWEVLKKGDIEFCQAIWEFGDDAEPDWVHVSYATVTRKNTREFLRAIKRNGKTVYLKA